MSYHIKLGLTLPGDNEGLNGPGDAEGFPKSLEAFQSTLTQNKATATGGRWIWSKLGDPALVLTPPPPKLVCQSCLGLFVHQEGNNSEETLEVPHSGGPQAQGLTEEYFWKPNKNMPCQ